jgi:hypothetical protein
VHIGIGPIQDGGLPSFSAQRNKRNSNGLKEKRQEDFDFAVKSGVARFFQWESRSTNRDSSL